MADSKVSDLSTLTGALSATGDKYLILDASDTTDSGQGTLKAITRAELYAAMVEAGFGATSRAIISDTQADGVHGGTLTLGAWRTRVLNTEDYDPDGIVSITSNQFTLGAGTYYIKAWAIALDVDGHQLRLQNITDTTTDITGTLAHAQNANSTTTHAILEGFISIAGEKAFELQHQSGQTRATNGMGYAFSFGINEKYAQISINKIA